MSEPSRGRACLRLADPELGQKPLLAKLREQQPDLGAGTKEVREVLAALKAESEAKAQAEAAATTAATAAATTPQPAVDEGGAPPNAALSLACVGCGRLPSDMDDDREKHPVCHKCVKAKVPTTYWCGLNCPANPGAWELHAVYHKELKKYRKAWEDGGVRQQWYRDMAERKARLAAQTGDKYDELLAEGARYASQEDTRRAARACREAIALRPNEPTAYHALGSTLSNSGHLVEAAQRYLEAKGRYPVGSEGWARVTAAAFDVLRLEECAEVAKPEWWNDEELKALSVKVVRAAPNNLVANCMRAMVLCAWLCGAAWEVGPRSAAELKKAATYFDRAATLSDAPAVKAPLAGNAEVCRSQAETM